MADDGCSKSPRKRTSPRDAVVVADVAVLVDVPVVDAQRALALERVVVVGHRVEQPARPDRIGLLVGVDRHGDVVRPQVQAEVKARDSRADDADARSHAADAYPRAAPRDQWRGATASDAESASVGWAPRWWSCATCARSRCSRPSCTSGAPPCASASRSRRSAATSGASSASSASCWPTARAARVRLTDAGHELATALPGALRQLERTLEATRAAAEGGWEI